MFAFRFDKDMDSPWGVEGLGAASASETSAPISASAYVERDLRIVLSDLSEEREEEKERERGQRTELGLRAQDRVSFKDDRPRRGKRTRTRRCAVAARSRQHRHSLLWETHNNRCCGRELSGLSAGIQHRSSSQYLVGGLQVCSRGNERWWPF